MSVTGVKQTPELPEQPMLDPSQLDERELAAARARQAELLRLLWEHRHKLFRVAVVGLLISVLVAFLIPKSYTSTAQLMPPDGQANNGLAMMAALAGKTLGGLAGITGDLLGMKSSGALFVGVLRSETAQNRIVQQFDLQKVYGTTVLADARKRLDDNTVISEDRKSGIITIKVTDHDPQRSAAIANAYIDELNSLVAQLSTSAAHRERVFLEDRLKVAKVDLDDAANQLAQFSSKNNTLDIQIEGKAMLDAAGSLAGQLIAAEAELQGLREIYTGNNARVRALSARVADLRKELEKFGGVEQDAKNKASTPPSSPLLTTGDPPPDKSALSAFPTIRKLPLLGAKYTEYYRRAKIEETVYELLTEQYEMAKVQEAKETPSVKVLDPGRVPERKSFPPRLMIVFLGTCVALACAAIWIVVRTGWEKIDPQDPRKLLAVEMASTLRARAPWAEKNGHASHLWVRRTLARLKGQNQSVNDTDS